MMVLTIASSIRRGVVDDFLGDDNGGLLNSSSRLALLEEVEEGTTRVAALRQLLTLLLDRCGFGLTSSEEVVDEATSVTADGLFPLLLRGVKCDGFASDDELGEGLITLGNEACSEGQASHIACDNVRASVRNTRILRQLV